jgi:ABC-type uncharacterized transport system ATPase subunit
MDWITIYRRLSILWARAHEETYPLNAHGNMIMLPDAEYQEKFDRLERIINLTLRVEDRIRGYYNAGRVVAR